MSRTVPNTLIDQNASGAGLCSEASAPQAGPDNDDAGKDVFREWAIVELFGHQKCVGLVTEASLAGAKFIRIEVLNKQGTTSTRFYGASAIYCLSPVTEQIARAMAGQIGSDPVTRMDLERLSRQPVQAQLPYSENTDEGDHYD